MPEKLQPRSQDQMCQTLPETSCQGTIGCTQRGLPMRNPHKKSYITWVLMGEKKSQESLGSTIDLAYCPLILLIGRSEKHPRKLTAGRAPK